MGSYYFSILMHSY